MKTVIFDMDDTLIQTGQSFFRIRHEIFDIIKSHTGLDESARRAYLAVYDFIESKNVREKGFQKDRFPLSAGESYEVFAIAHGLVAEPEVRRLAEQHAWSVFEAECPTHLAAGGVLAALDRQGVRLVLCTKGDPAIQAGRLAKSGLASWFADRVEIPLDKTPAIFAELVAKYGLKGEQTFVVGDSLKSDILPAVANGLKAIHIPSTGTWSYFESASVPAEKFHTAQDLNEALSILIKELDLA